MGNVQSNVEGLVENGQNTRNDNETESDSSWSDEPSNSEDEINFSYENYAEPVASIQEQEQYMKVASEQNERDTIMGNRFQGNIEIDSWCDCSHCSLEGISKKEECFCCCEIAECRELLDSINTSSSQNLDTSNVMTCICFHPGFISGCLDEWVLLLAGLGLRTRKGKRYDLMYKGGSVSRNRYLRSVSYRQFSRLVWGYLGCSKRFPLPCCAYSAIRQKFPSEDGQYKGFEEEEEEEEDDDDEEEEEEEEEEEDDD